MSRYRTRCLQFAAVAIAVNWGGGQLFAQNFAGAFATRFTPTGSVDESFGHQGVVGVFGPDGYATAATIDEENRIIVAGTRDSKFVVARLSPSGGPDRSFGSYGVATRAFAAGAEARAVAVDPFRRIIVAGTSDEQFAVACFSDSGGKCAFGGGDSNVTTSFAHPAEAAAIAVAGDGSIVVGGTVRHFDGVMNQKFAVARYDAFDGLDLSFGLAGRVVYDVAGPPPGWPPGVANIETISGITVDSSGRIVAAGTFSAEHVSKRFAVLRFLGDGSPDTTFGPDSTGMSTVFGGCSWAGCFEEAEATSLTLQPNGKIVVAGWARRLGSVLWDGDVALTRLLPDGSRDTSGFGIDGYVLTDVGGFGAAARAVKIAGGSLFVAGYAFAAEQAMVARYSLSNGALDTAFGGGVLVGTSCPTGHSSPALALVVQTFPCRGTFCLPTRKPVIAGACLSNF